MRKTLILFAFLFLGNALFSQTDWTKYEAIVNVDSKNSEELSQLITKPFSTTREKSEAIYYWVTNNIKYDFRELKKLKKKDDGKPKRVTTDELLARKNKMIKETLKQKKGICQDYSILFKTLCIHADIECEEVSGWLKNNSQKTSEIGGRHAWNAVKIDNEWEVVDPTAGSGYRNRKGKFEFSFNPNYFCADKEIFKMSHFPREEKWQLAAKKVDKMIFKKFPFIGNGFIDLNGKNISPTENKIAIKRGSSVEVTFDSEKPISKLVVANLKKGKRVECEVERVDNKNSIRLNALDFRSGLYSFYNEERLIFVYRITIK